MRGRQTDNREIEKETDRRTDKVEQEHVQYGISKRYYSKNYNMGCKRGFHPIFSGEYNNIKSRLL